MTAHQGTSRGTGQVSWILLCLGLSGFVPCILVPEWRALEHVAAAEQAERDRLGEMERRVERESQALEAIQTDPEVVARLAQRELNFRRENSLIVDVPLAAPAPAPGVGRFIHSGERESAAPADHRAPNEIAASGPPADWPMIGRLAGWLPGRRYDAVFCDPTCRTVIVTMCIVLFVVAIWMVCPRYDRGAIKPGR